MRIHECLTYLPSHLMARDRDEEQIRLIWIFRHKLTIPKVLKEVSFTRIFSGEFPGRLIIGLRIPIGVHIHLKSLQHLSIVQPKHLRRMVNVVFLRIAALLSISLRNNTFLRTITVAVINILRGESI